MSYARNKERAKTINNEPTLTDQSQAENTDINIIVTQFMRTGQAPQGAQPVYADYSEFPTDLKSMFDMARNVKEQVEALPVQLQGIPLEQLVRMTTEQINAMLPKPEDKQSTPVNPPAKPDDPPAKETK